MVEVVTLCVLLQETERLSAGSLDSIDHVIKFSKINLIIVSNNLTLALGLQTHLYNVSGLVVEETVGISEPRNGSEKDYWFL